MGLYLITFPHHQVDTAAVNCDTTSYLDDSLLSFADEQIFLVLYLVKYSFQFSRTGIVGSFIPAKKFVIAGIRTHRLTLPARSGNALLRRLVRIGVLEESRMKLDFVLGLKVEDFLERRLQTQVFKLGLAKSIHHARVLIRQRHIRYGTGNVVIVGPGVRGIPGRHSGQVRYRARSEWAG